jgi:PAS domain S-box-containing protein
VLGGAAGPLTDVYALGVILYEILVGKCPYQAEGTLELLLQVRAARVRPPSQLRGDIPPALEAICLKAMAYPPSARYQTAAVLAHAVEDWLADELVRSEAALRESEEQVRLLLDSTAEAIYGVDLKGNCTFCNPACARMLGYPDPRELLGQHMHKVAHHHRPDGTPYPVEECRIYQAFQEGRGTHVKDEVFWRADGTSFPAEYWSYPVRRDGVVIGSVVTFLDITEQIGQERVLARAKQAAEYDAQAARERLASFLRQLPGPVEEIALMTDRLLDTELSADQRGYLTRTQIAAKALLGLAGTKSASAEEVT